MPISHSFLRSPWFRHLIFPAGSDLLLAAVFYVVIYQAPPNGAGEAQSSPLDPLFLYGGLLVPGLIAIALSFPLGRRHRALGGWTALTLVLSMGVGAWYQKWYSAIPLEPWFYKSMSEDVNFWAVYSLYGFVFVLAGLSLGALYELADARPEVLEVALSPLLGTTDKVVEKSDPGAEAREALSKSARRKKKRKKRLDERKTEMSTLLTEVLADGKSAEGEDEEDDEEDEDEDRPDPAGSTTPGAAPKAEGRERA